MVLSNKVLESRKVKKGMRRKFTKDEDRMLDEAVRKFRGCNWDLIAQALPGRNVRQCKERWYTYLAPNTNTSVWTPEEDQLLLDKVAQYGNKWTRMASFFNCRSATNIKNRYSILSRRASRAPQKRGRKPKREKLTFQAEQQTECDPQLVSEKPLDFERDSIFESLDQHLEDPNEFIPDEFDISVFMSF